MRTKNTNMNYGTGRRKCAIARVWVERGEGLITINGRDVSEYFGRPVLDILVKSPLVHMEMLETINVRAKVKGGGLSGQAGAVRLGISRALLDMNDEYRSLLRAGGFLTRDARVKERKKYGFKKARRGFQFVKR
jgi:small subunit ribosomal protein S9